jgi:hypothetical protein
VISCAEYIAASKTCLGDPRLSDARLGERLKPTYSQSAIAAAKSGRMSDGIALAIGELLQKHGVIDHAGEVLLVAHAERDANPAVRKALMAYAKKVLDAVPSKAAAAVTAIVVVLSSLFPAHDAHAGVAEAVRFELTEGFPLRWFSRPVP